MFHQLCIKSHIMAKFPSISIFKLFFDGKLSLIPEMSFWDLSRKFSNCAALQNESEYPNIKYLTDMNTGKIQLQLLDPHN